MSSVVLMLSGEGKLPQPKQPGFFTERTLVEANSSSIKNTSCSVNDSTITLLEARQKLFFFVTDIFCFLSCSQKLLFFLGSFVSAICIDYWVYVRKRQLDSFVSNMNLKKPLKVAEMEQKYDFHMVLIRKVQTQKPHATTG